MDYTLRKYKEEDYEFVYHVKEVCYKKYVEEFFGAWDEKVQREMYKSYLDACKNYIEIIIVDGERAGFVDGHSTDNDNYEQGNICLLPEFRGKSIGSEYLRDVLNKHKKQNIGLKVFKSNPAQNLYKRLGFEIVGETNSHYLMKKDRQVEKDK